ncbi:MAG: hypothetical protein ACXACH_06235 [Candidatus Hermodarchaeia archaeon]
MTWRSLYTGVLAVMLLLGMANFIDGGWSVDDPLGDIACTSGGVSCKVLRAPPNVLDVTQDPVDPEYFESVTINCAVEMVDNPIARVDVYYSSNSAPWRNLTATEVGSDVYQCVIPAHPWYTAMRYYVNATTVFGESTIEDNGGQYYQYLVIDTIPPMLWVTAPQNESTVTGEFVIEINWDDAGSWCDHVDKYVDGVHTGVLYGQHGQLVSTKNTDHMSEGWHSWAWIAYDNAGNSKRLALVLYTQHSPTYIPPIPGFPWEGLVLGVLLSLLLVIGVRQRRCGRSVSL